MNTRQVEVKHDDELQPRQGVNQSLICSRLENRNTHFELETPSLRNLVFTVCVDVKASFHARIHPLVLLSASASGTGTGLNGLN